MSARDKILEERRKAEADVERAQRQLDLKRERVAGLDAALAALDRHEREYKQAIDDAAAPAGDWKHHRLDPKFVLREKGRMQGFMPNGTDIVGALDFSGGEVKSEPGFFRSLLQTVWTPPFTLPSGFPRPVMSPGADHEAIARENEQLARSTFSVEERQKANAAVVQEMEAETRAVGKSGVLVTWDDTGPKYELQSVFSRPSK